MFGISQGNERKDLKELGNIEKDLLNGLLNSGEDQKEITSGVSGSPVLLQSGIVVPKYVSKIFCDVKNGMLAKILSRDLDDDIKDIIRDEFSTTEKEIEIYRAILEQVGNQYLPEQHKEWVAKIICSPIIVAIEFEMERTIKMNIRIKKMVRDAKKSEVVA